jgi:muramidase (phage lysozyme)
LENEGKQVPFFRFLEIGTISFELGEIGERYASLTNKQTNKIENDLEKIRKSMRSHFGSYSSEKIEES